MRPEKNSTEELVIIAKPSLIANVALSAVVVRQEAPLRSNLLEHPLPCPNGQSREFAGPMMHKARQLDAEKWRANHYVQALGGRKVLYRSEDCGFLQIFDPFSYVGTAHATLACVHLATRAFVDLLHNFLAPHRHGGNNRGTAG